VYFPEEFGHILNVFVDICMTYLPSNVAAKILGFFRIDFDLIGLLENPVSTIDVCISVCK